MSGVIPLLPQYVFMAWYLVKARGQLYLLLCDQYQKMAGRMQFWLITDQRNYSSLNSDLISYIL